MTGFRPIHLFLALALAPLFWAAGSALGPAALVLFVWLLARPLSREPEGRAVLQLLALFAALWIVHEARWVVYPLIGGILLAFILLPMVTWLETRGIRRPLAAALSLLPVLLFAGLAFALLVPAIGRQVQILAAQLPEAYERLQEWARPLTARLNPGGAAPADTLAAARAAGAGAPADSLAAAANAGVPPWIASLTHNWTNYLEGAARGLLGVGRGLGKALQVASVAVLSPVVAFYLVLDWERAGAFVADVLPGSLYPHSLRLSSLLRGALARYVRGQLMVAGVEVVLFCIAYALAGLSQPIVLGVLSGLFCLIPVLGFWLTVLVVLLAGLTSPEPAAALLKALIGLGVINVLENQVLVPRIQGPGLGLPPLVVLLGVLLFGSLFGIVGVLLALPVLAVIHSELLEWRARKHRGEAGGDGAGDG